MRLAETGHVLQHRLPPRPAEVAADARIGLRRAAQLRRTPSWSTIRRDFADPDAAPAAHLRHGRRLVGLAAARRRTRRAGGRRHQRRHLRAVEGDHAQRRGAAPLQVGRRRQYGRQRARLRSLARCVPRRRHAASRHDIRHLQDAAGGARASMPARATAASAPNDTGGRSKASSAPPRMPVTGLATRPLLQALAGESQVRHRQDRRTPATHDRQRQRANRRALQSAVRSLSSASIARSFSSSAPVSAARPRAGRRRLRRSARAPSSTPRTSSASSGASHNSSVCAAERRVAAARTRRSGPRRSRITCASLSPALSRSRTSRRRSRASGALLSSIDWFWQTRQRRPEEIWRARASSAASGRISSGSTAQRRRAHAITSSERRCEATSGWPRTASFGGRRGQRGARGAARRRAGGGRRARGRRRGT